MHYSDLFINLIFILGFSGFGKKLYIRKQKQKDYTDFIKKNSFNLFTKLNYYFKKL